MAQEGRKYTRGSVYLYSILGIVFLINGVVYLRMGRTLLGVLDLLLAGLDELYAWLIYKELRSEE